MRGLNHERHTFHHGHQPYERVSALPGTARLLLEARYNIAILPTAHDMECDAAGSFSPIHIILLALFSPP